MNCPARLLQARTALVSDLCLWTCASGRAGDRGWACYAGLMRAKEDLTRLARVPQAPGAVPQPKYLSPSTLAEVPQPRSPPAGGPNDSRRWRCRRAPFDRRRVFPVACKPNLPPGLQGWWDRRTVLPVPG